MANYPVQSPTHAGVALTMVAPTTGAVDTVQPGPGTFLAVQSGASGAATLSLPLPNYDGTQAVGPRSLGPFPSNSLELVPIPTSVYGPNPITLTWGGTLTTVTVAAATVTTT